MPGFTFDRLAGEDRFATAVAIAEDGFGTSDTVILASGAERNFPDALTGNFLAGEEQAPILLTLPGFLPRPTRDAFTSLNVQRVIIVGGTSAVSAQVEAEVDRLVGTVERVGGIDRYATAQLVAQRVAGSQPATSTNVGEDPQGRRTAILGNGQNFPDILAAGPLSFAEQFPITITEGGPNTPETTRNRLNPRTRDVLEDLNIERVLIVGETAAVSAAVETEVRTIVGNNVTRLGGGARDVTAVRIADFAYDQLGFDTSHINLARSDVFADALTGGPHGGLDRAPIVITRPEVLTSPTREILERRCPTLVDGHIFGGPVAISFETEAAAEAAASRCTAATQPEATVVVTDNSVAAGENVTGTITATDGTIQTVTVSGCGIDTARTLTDQSTDANFQFTVQIPADQPAGQCTLTFTTTFTDGSTDVDTVQITVEAPAQQNLGAPSVTPDTEETRTVTANPDATTTDDRTFQISGLTSGETFRITLVRCENVQGQGREALFLASADPNSSTGFSADTGSPSADIVSVNGNNIGDQSTDAGFQSGTTTFVASGTTATFTIDGDAAECVLPVVYFDSTTANTSEGGNSPRLEVQATAAGQFGRAVEDVDTGGRTNFVAAAAAPAPGGGGPANSATVQDPDPGQDVQQSDTFTVNVTGNNIRSVVIDGPCVPRSQVTDTDSDSTNGVQGSARVRPDAAVGPCTLTFTTTFTDGTTEQDQVTIDIVAEDTATVTQPTAGQDVQRSDTFTATVTGTNIASVTVDGPCLTGPTTLVVNSDGTMAAGPVATRGDAPIGPCTLTFTTTFRDGETEQDQVTIDIVAEDTATVTTPASVQQGDTFTATIEGSNLASVSVTATDANRCLEPDPQMQAATSNSMITQVVQTSDSATVGTCTLVFTTTFTDGESESDTRTIEITPAPPTGLFETPMTTTPISTVLTVTGVIDGATVRIFGEQVGDGAGNDTAEPSDPLVAESSVDANPDDDGFQILVPNPNTTGGGTSTFIATQTVGVLESPPSPSVDVTFPALALPPP